MARPDKKNPYDRTSTVRSARMSEQIKEAGGAVFTVRLQTKDEVSALNDLIAGGFGANRNDVIRKLILERAEAIKPSKK
jgi:hypothetical protein